MKFKDEHDKGKEQKYLRNVPRKKNFIFIAIALEHQCKNVCGERRKKASIPINV